MVDATGERARPTSLVDDGRDRRGRRRPRRRAIGARRRRAASSRPGLVDLHAHFREPGREEAETVETGAACRRARRLHRGRRDAEHRAGRSTRAAVVREVLDLGAQARLCDVRVAGCDHRRPARASSSRRWRRWPTLGVRLFTDDGDGVQDDRLMRRALEYAAGLGVDARAALRGRRRSPRGGHMHEGEWSSRLGIPGSPAEAEELMVDARHRARPGSPARRSTSCTCRRPARSRWCAPPRPTACRVTAEARRTTSRSPTPSARRYDPVFKVNPPLRTDADVDAVRAGLGRRHDRRDRHRPRAARPETKEQPFDEAPPGMLGLETALALALTELEPAARPAVLALLSWQPARDRRARRHATAARSRPGRAANLCVIDPDRRRGSSTARALGEPQPQHAVRRAASSPGTGAPHDPARASPSSSTTRGARDEPIARAESPTALLVLADGTTFEGEAIGRRPRAVSQPARSCSTPRSSGYQEIVTDPSYAGQIITFTYPHIGNYGVNARRRRERARRSAAASSSATSRAGRQQLARDRATSTASSRGTGVAGIAGIDTRRLTRHIRDAGAMPGAFGTADRDTLLAAAQADGGTDGVRPRRDGHDAPSRTPSARRRGRSTSSPTTSASSARSSTSSSRGLPGRGRARVDDRRPTCSPAQPDGVFLSNGPGDPGGGRRTRSRNVEALLGEVPVFGICLGHQIMALALGARDVQAAVRPPRRQPSGAPPRDRPGRDHEPEPQLRGRRRLAARRRRRSPT